MKGVRRKSESDFFRVNFKSKAVLFCFTFQKVLRCFAFFVEYSYVWIGLRGWVYSVLVLGYMGIAVTGAYTVISRRLRHSFFFALPSSSFHVTSK